MRQALRLHPDSNCAAVTQIAVDVARPRLGTLVLCYEATGKLNDLRMPTASASTRGDELWRHTCFEAFIRAAPSTAYYELNFAPSTQWAAYGFNGYRSGMRLARDMSGPRFKAISGHERYTLEVAMDLGQLPGLPNDADWRLGLSAVIEETSGRISYWALTHPSGKPDFHHSDCFAHELPAAYGP